eukprot:scaffold10521_cov36-Phaeocystis_antarctica.AAC.1
MTPAARPATSGGQAGRPVSRAALSGSRPGTSSGARGARSGATGLAEEDAACYLECELLLYGSAGAYAVAQRLRRACDPGGRPLKSNHNPNPNPNSNPSPDPDPSRNPDPNPNPNPNPNQVASAKRFGWAKQTERRQMTESEGATK